MDTRHEWVGHDAGHRPEPVGYWHACEGDGLPHPQQLVQPRWEWRRRRRIIRYLEGGAERLQYRGWSHCRFGCWRPNGTRDITDGTWVWPEGLAHYVRVHGIMLPDEFVRHMAAHGFTVPRPTASMEHPPNTARAFWRQWAARQRPFRPIACCYGCDAERHSSGTRQPVIRRIPFRGLFDRLWYYVGWRSTRADRRLPPDQPGSPPD